MVYSKELECLITAGEDCTIQLYYLSQVVPTFNDVALPTSFEVNFSGSKHHALAVLAVLD
jgi:hypothetical protein